MQTQNVRATGPAPGESEHRFSSQWSESLTYPAETHPLSTTLVVFGAGLAVGAVIGSMIAEAASPPRRLSSAESLGRSLLDSMNAIVPDVVSRHLGGK